MASHPVVAAFSSPPAKYERAHEAKRARAVPHHGNFLDAIRAHWRLFAGVFLACVALGTAGTLLAPKQYTATAKMIVGSPQTAADAAQSNASSASRTSPALQTAALSSDTIVDLIREGPVVEKVIDTLKLDQSRAQVLGRIDVRFVPNTPIVSLSATWGNPTQAVAIANTFAGVFIDRDRELIGAQAVAAQARLQTAISTAQDALQQANGALAAYQAKYEIADPTQQTQPLLQRVRADESTLRDLQDDRAQSQARLSSALAQIAALPPTIAGQQATDVNPASTALRQQLAETEMQLATARRRYTDQNPALVALEQQRDELQRQIAAEPVTVAGQTIAIPNPVAQQLSQEAATLRSHIQGDIAQIAELQRRHEALAPAIAAIPAQTTQLGLLQERANRASDIYKALAQKYDDAVVASNSAVSDVTVVQAAEADSVTVSPNIVFNVIASIVLGLIFGLLAVAIANSARRRVREDRQIERVLGLPVIAHIPSLTKQHQRALPWLQTATLKGFLHLCTALQVLRRNSGTHVIVLTSPEKGDGKTTIAYGLASAMSQILSRVLLIDADMRSPSTHLQAKIKNGRGLSEILSSRRSLDQVVVHHTATLDILTAGAPSANPGALVGSPAFDDLLNLARERYDCVIIDTPALGPVIDSALIAARADSTALVLSGDGSHEEAAVQAVARLRSLGVQNTLGIIMNRTSAKFGDQTDYVVYPSWALPSAH